MLKVLFVLIACILILFFIEQALRVYFRCFGKKYVWSPGRKTKLNIDKNALPRVAETAYLVANSDGELGTECPRGNIWRALVLGGSSTECYFLGSYGGWPFLLQEKLKNASKNQSTFQGVHLGSIAKSGLNARDLRLVLENLLGQYKQLNACVLMVGASDILSWMRNGALDSGAYRDPELYNIFSVNQAKKYTYRLKQFALFEVLRIFKNKFFQKEIELFDVGRSLVALRKKRQAAKTVLHDTGNPEKMLNAYEANLMQCLQLCKQKTNSIFLIQQPWFDRDVSEEEGKNFWNAAKGHAFFEDTDTYYSMDAFRGCMELIRQRTSDVAQKMDIEVIDVQKQFPSDFENFYDCVHFTNAGAEKVADIIYKYLCNTTLFDDCCHDR